MADFTLELKNSKVLLKDDIIRIRQYIENKYPHYDQRKRAQVLAQTIEGIINHHIAELPPKYHQDLRQLLFKGPLLTNADGLFLFDIFETSLALSIEDDGFSIHLTTWANSHLSKPIDEAEIKEYKKSLHKIKLPVHLEETNIENLPNQENEEPQTFHQPKYFFRSLKPTYILVSLLSIYFLNQFITTISANKEVPLIEVQAPIVRQYPHLPEDFYYRDIDEGKLIEYLEGRNALLSEEPYFSAIINTAKEFELNPLILFAIAGHEQGFVPKTHPSATTIANNPFNVFYSWQRYNTNIVDSSRIAARTIINSSKEKPEGIDPFQWINRRYAEDQNWWKGVSSLYKSLEKAVE